MAWYNTDICQATLQPKAYVQKIVQSILWNAQEQQY